MQTIKHSWEDKCFHAEVIRVYAIILILLSIVCGILLLANKQAHKSGGHDLSPLFYPAIFLFVLGLTNLFGRRIPAIALSLISCVVAGWHFWGGITLVLYSPMAFVANTLIGFIAIIPMYSTIRGWQALR